MSVTKAQELIKRLGEDVAFRQSVENAATPQEKKQILENAGFGGISQNDIQAAAATAGAELSDLELEAVAGGRTASWVEAVSTVVGAAAAAAAA
jgi:predicted ribosomally synthesized peptide with nif11-like leader